MWIKFGKMVECSLNMQIYDYITLHYEIFNVA